METKNHLLSDKLNISDMEMDIQGHPICREQLSAPFFGVLDVENNPSVLLRKEKERSGKRERELDANRKSKKEE